MNKLRKRVETNYFLRAAEQHFLKLNPFGSKLQSSQVYSESTQ